MSFYKDNDPDLRALVGLRVVGLSVSEDQSAIKFDVVNHAPIVWRVSGDCCSESWWADITGIKQLTGANEVTNVVILELLNEQYNTDDGRGRQESDQAYGFGVKTTRGACTLVFRNSSNGYYGGDASLSEVEEWDKWIVLTGRSEWAA